MITVMMATLALSAGGSSGCNSHACEVRVRARVQKASWRRSWERRPLGERQLLRRIAACESGSSGDTRAVSAGGTYRGRYQFNFGTWRTVGGKGDPINASGLEQDVRAGRLYDRRGVQPWLVCGPRAVR